jgi:putative FmdB family regulatory protein
VHDEPREAEVERCAAAFRDDCVQYLAERAATDEERERLVLVRWPGAQVPAEDSRQRRCHGARSGPEGVHFPDSRAGARQRGGTCREVDHGLSLYVVQADDTASVLNLVPTYEYKCPNGHVFEVFKRIADPPPEECPVCGASPVETVLYPVPVHFRGSGFYSTDYGRGGRKRDRAKESSSESGSDSGSGDKKEKKDTSTEKQAAEG